MAAIKLKILVVELDNVLTQFDQIKVYRSTTGEAGPFAEITGPTTRIPLVAGTTLYEYIDTSGDVDYWYRFSFYNSTTTLEGTASTPIQGEGVEGRYCTIADMRAEGVLESQYDDARVTTAIELSSRMIDMYTGRWFEPRTMDFTMDGSGQPSMLLEHPIISITDALIDDVALAASDLIVYNRHITQNLLSPDDREDPHVEIRQPLDDSLLFKIGLKVWPRGQLNIRFQGVFGYTDYDGTASGSTPALIQHACKLLTMRNLPGMADVATREDAAMAWRVIEHKTRDQSIKYSPADITKQGRAAAGLYTGNPEIDMILLRYRKTPKMRSI